SHYLSEYDYAELVSIRAYSNAIMPLFTISLMLGFPKFHKLGKDIIFNVFKIYFISIIFISAVVILSWYLLSIEDFRIQAVISLALGSSLVAVYGGVLRAERLFLMLYSYTIIVAILGMGFLIMFVIMEIPVQEITLYQGIFFISLVLMLVFLRKTKSLYVPSKNDMDTLRPLLNFCLDRISSGLLKKVFFIIPILLLDFLNLTQELIAFSTALIIMRVMDSVMSFTSGPIISYANSNYFSKNKLDAITIKILLSCFAVTLIGWYSSAIISQFLPYLFNFNDEIFILIERVLGLIGLYFSAIFLRTFYDAFTESANVTKIYIRATAIGIIPLLLGYFMEDDMIFWIFLSLLFHLSYVCYQYTLALLSIRS
ncbi:hypothetical protein OAL98_04020, partial [Gammaproteobacteria bacterium]|nr:hypothetical protein [Gammaproteobacteria bacterium]